MMKSRNESSFESAALKGLNSKFSENAALTPKEEKIFGFIKSYIESNDYPPTYTEIQEKFGYRSVYSIQQFVDQLATKGYLKPSLGENKKRSLELVHSSNESEMVSIPLEGSVAAGRLTHSYQNREYVEVPRQLLKDTAEYFSLRVKGDSMIEDCIMDGDLVIIKRQGNATNGQTVVALVGDEATIKRFYKKKDMIELHPANPQYSIIQVKPDAEFKILGVLSSVIRTLE